MAEIPTGWEVRGKPPALFRRYTFSAYAQCRDFLDALAALSETIGMHPQNINFGTGYANITLEAADGVALGDVDYGFARQINALVGEA